MDTLTRFKFENHLAHGAIVEISTGVSEILDNRAYGPDVRALIGEAMAAMPLLATHLSFEGRINLQFQGDAGPMKLLVAQVDEQLNVRGMAKAAAELRGGFTELLYGGLLSVMVEPRNAEGQLARNPTQALVLIQGDTLAAALEAYFAQSEQLPTLIRLAARGDQLRGFMLQRLPLENTRVTDEDWQHLVTLGATLSADEMFAADATTLLRRLFHAEDIRVFAPRPVHVTCRCGRPGIANMLLQLGREEVDGILAEQGKVEVTCEFCGTHYLFDSIQVGALFAGAPVTDWDTRH